MKFFLDTASLEAIEEWQTYGLVQGVTTNPALLAKEGRDPLDQLRDVARAVEGPVSAQVTADNAEQMIVQGGRLREIADNIVVKVPATREGCRAAQSLSGQGARCNITLTFDPAQAVPFLQIPAAYVSLIVGRPEDFGLNSVDQVAALREIIDRLGSPTELLCASIRNPHHLQAAIRGGSDVITVPPLTWDNVFSQPLTLEGERDFMRAWGSLPESARKAYEDLAS